MNFGLKALLNGNQENFRKGYNLIFGDKKNKKKLKGIWKGNRKNYIKPQLYQSAGKEQKELKEAIKS